MKNIIAKTEFCVNPFKGSYMGMFVPIFLLFSIYASVNAYLPLFLRNMGYSLTSVGFLMGAFEIAGAILPFFLCSIPAKTGRYVLFLGGVGLLLAILPFPILNLPYFALTALLLGIYAALFKSAVPVSDSLVSLRLGEKRELYGRVRAAGSAGFVLTNLIMQRFIKIENISPMESALWMTVPALLFILSLFTAEDLNQDNKKVLGLAQTTFVKGKEEDISRYQFSPHYWLVMLLIFLTLFGQMPSARFFSIYVKEYLHSNAAGALWALSALSEIPFMFFSNRFIKRFGSLRLLLICAAASTVRNLIYVFMPSLGGAAVGQLFNSLTFGLFHPAAVMFAASQAPNKEQAVFSQAVYSVGTIGLAGVLGNVLGGVLIDKFGYPTLYSLFAVFPILGIASYGFLRKKVDKMP